MSYERIMESLPKMVGCAGIQIGIPKSEPWAAKVLERARNLGLFIFSDEVPGQHLIRGLRNERVPVFK